MSTDLQQLKKALANNEAHKARAILARQQHPTALIKAAIKGPEFFDKNTRCNKILPVILQYWPELARMKDGTGTTALIYLARTANITGMRALVDAGADIDATTPAGDTAGACVVRIRCTTNMMKKKDIPVLRRMGVSFNAPVFGAHTPLQWALGRGDYDLAEPLLNAGANAHMALGLPAGKKLTWQEVHDALESLYRSYSSRNEEDIERDASFLIAEQQFAIKSCPGTAAHPACFEHFFDPAEDGGNIPVLRPRADKLNAFSLLHPLFTPEAAPRWKDGMNEMVRTYAAFPHYLQREIPMIPVLRNAPLPHQNSVTVRYMKGMAPERSHD